MEGSFTLTVKLNKTLNQFADFLPWIEELREIDKNLWLKPISPRKWSLREILAHIMYWDKNSLEMMVPNMAEGAKLSFVDIEKHNQEAAVFSQTYNTLDDLINDLIKTRQKLVELLLGKYDDKTTFTIDNRNYKYKKFVHVFIHHDEHHKKQIEAFLEREKGL